MNNIRDIIDDNTLGVHVRGTDFNNHLYDHPTQVTSNQHVEVALNAMEKYGFTKVFVATDEEKILEQFKTVFGDNLVYYSDVYRSTDGKAVHLSNVARENHKYLAGLEVLRDMYTLSYCKGFIAGISMVSTSVLITKESRNEKFVYKNIIDNGINKSGKRFK